jgi:hypothetical protein
MGQRLIILAVENVVKKTPEKCEWISISSTPYTFLRKQRELPLYILHTSPHGLQQEVRPIQPNVSQGRIGCAGLLPAGLCTYNIVIAAQLAFPSCSSVRA